MINQACRLNDWVLYVITMSWVIKVTTSGFNPIILSDEVFIAWVFIFPQRLIDYGVIISIYLAEYAELIVAMTVFLYGWYADQSFTRPFILDNSIISCFEFEYRTESLIMSSIIVFLNVPAAFSYVDYMAHRQDAGNLYLFVNCRPL